VCTKQDQEKEQGIGYLFRTHLVITISAVVSGRLSVSEWKFFFIKHQLYVNG